MTFANLPYWDAALISIAPSTAGASRKYLLYQNKKKNTCLRTVTKANYSETSNNRLSEISTTDEPHAFTIELTHFQPLRDGQPLNSQDNRQKNLPPNFCKLYKMASKVDRDRHYRRDIQSTISYPAAPRKFIVFHLVYFALMSVQNMSA